MNRFIGRVLDGPAVGAMIAPGSEAVIGSSDILLDVVVDDTSTGIGYRYF